MPATATATEAVDWVAEGRRLARDVLRAWAPAVDAEGRFPHESLEALAQAGFMGFLVPPAQGGAGGDARTLCAVAAALAEECLSTAVLWGMHCQQVAVLADGGFQDGAEALAEVARDGVLVASVTTEPGGSDLLHASSPLLDGGGDVRIVRSAPLVSGGEHAGWFLITMREGGATVLALVRRGEGVAEAVGPWEAMGMRGTRSVPMRFDVAVPRGRIVDAGFRELMARAMIPLGHLAWAAAWMGAARGAFRRTVRHLRAEAARTGKPADSEALRHRLASLRVRLDAAQALVDTVAARVDALRSGRAPAEGWTDPAFTIQLNNVKIAASENAFAVVDGLMDVCGLFAGYLRGGAPRVEQAFRDLRSGSLMYNNERLRQANGTLLFVEGARLQEMW